jgi:hypothetical protein
MNNYNEFYLLIEKRVSAINLLIKQAEKTLKANECSEKVRELSIKKKEIIEEAFIELQVPRYLQEEFRDEMFSDDEFEHLCLVA